MRVSSKLHTVQRQVDLLEAGGFKVHVHIQPHVESKDKLSMGLTEVAISDVNVPGLNIAEGKAWCSKKDAWDRNEGTKRAFRRAIGDFYKQVGPDHAKRVLYPKP